MKEKTSTTNSKIELSAEILKDLEDLPRKKVVKIDWTPEMDEVLKRTYSTSTREVIAKILSKHFVKMTRAAVDNRLKKLGLA